MRQPTHPTRSITAAALLMVLAACAPTAATTTTPTTAPAATATTVVEAPTTTVAPEVSPADVAAAVDIANGFVMAYAANDADKAAPYLAAEALSEFGGSVEAMRLEFRFNEAQAFKHMFDSCGVQETSRSGTTVRCPYAYHGIRSDEIGLGPYTGSWYDLVIQDGKIVSLEDHIVFLQNGFDAQIWGPFADWVTETYPEDVAIMYTPGQTNVRITEESIALWDQRSREYVALVNSAG